MATSELKQSILDLKAKILSDTTFVYTAVFNDQIKRDNEGKLQFPFPKPAVFIEIQSPQQGLALLGSGVTINENQVFKFSIVHEQLDAVSNGTLSTGMDENLDVFDLRDRLKRLLTGFKPTNCSELQYVEESQDYAHDQIYVYCISFKCSYVDVKGSGYDVDSTIWTDGTITNINLNTFDGWQSTKSYVANGNAVVNNDFIYLCSISNSDTTFTVGNWRLAPAWEPSGTYTITTSYVAYQGHIYQCAASNTDATFITANWTKIV